MDFDPSPRAQELIERAWAFLREDCLPAEELLDPVDPAGDRSPPPVLAELQERARELGLWNAFLPAVSGLTNVDYAPLAEISGWCPELMPDAMNCAAPDTGNMETLHLFGTPEQQRRWLDPLLEGTIRSAFAMTEPQVASSDATNIETSIRRDGDEWVVDGRKWWITGALDPRCQVFIVMGKTDPSAPAHLQQSMVLVPRDTPGLEVVRDLTVLGHTDRHGHAELRLTDVRVPLDHLLGEEGGGFAIAQARLGPGRIHHCMRAIGAAERALDLMVRRASSRTAFGGPLADHGLVQAAIAESRLEVEQVRLLCHKTAWLIDRHGARGARTEIAAIKLAAPRVACAVIDRAMQVHGGLGMCADTVLPRSYAWHRAMRLFDGPDEVHLRTIARAELTSRA